MKRVRYLRRILEAYVLGGSSQLSFWHEAPQVHSRSVAASLGPYYMTFATKANYDGVNDGSGIPLLDYRGDLGPKYNPIAISQFGLGNFNEWLGNGDDRSTRLRHVVLTADWLVANLESNHCGVPVWHHYFDWEYRDTLRAPWYSGLAQGQGISLLHRAHAATGKDGYFQAAVRAYQALTLTIDQGGVVFVDQDGDPWIEEYIVDPPTHILNGFMWALWGVWDHWLVTREPEVKRFFDSCVQTLLKNLHRYDIGYWSLYEQSGTRLPMIASPFYHSLHIVQLEVLFRLTGHESFRAWAEKWTTYQDSRMNRTRALAQKIAFKLLYY
jgi:heparosan-N-sulfate-glucuronate 5-epimerase